MNTYILKFQFVADQPEYFLSNLKINFLCKLYVNIKLWHYNCSRKPFFSFLL